MLNDDTPDQDELEDYEQDFGLTTFERIHKNIHKRGAMDGVNRYNPENLAGFLEKYVDAQVSEGKYDLSTNLSILKLYQLNQDNYNEEIAMKILVLAMVRFPNADFSLAKCLLDQSRLDRDEIKQLLALAADYEQCRFENVWRTLNTVPEITQGVLGFQEAVRQYACYVVNQTYQNISKKTLLSLLGNISESELKTYANQNGWRIEGDYVHIANMEDTVKSKNIAEKIDFNSVQDIMKLALHN